MKTIIFEGELNNENVQKLVDDIQQPYEDEPETSIVLYFSSEGGYLHCGNILIDVINSLPEHYNLKMVFFWKVFSCAFDVFVKAKCKKEAYTGSVGLVHLMNRDVGVLGVVNDKDSLDRFLVDELNDGNEVYLKWLSSLPKMFSSKEVKKISHGQDVYITAERLEQFLKRQKK